MSYTALYRKFRPDEFEAVKGQDAIVRSNVQVDRSGYIDARDRDRCGIE